MHGPRTTNARRKPSKGNRVLARLLPTLAAFSVLQGFSPFAASAVPADTRRPEKFQSDQGSSTSCELALQLNINAPQWRADIRAMIDTIERHHRSPFHYTSKAKLEKAAETLEDQVSSLSAEAIPVRMAQIVALVGDGHTRLVEPPHPTYPVRVYWFGQDLRVISTTADYAELLGSRVERIGQYEAREVRARLKSLIPQDENRWLEMNRTPALLTDATILFVLGIATEPNHVDIQVVRDAGIELTRSLSAVSEGIAEIHWIQPFSAPPPYLAHQNEDFWFTTLPGTTSTYVSFNKYSGFEQNAQKLLRYIQDTHPDRLIIDMRENSGGDFGLPREYLLPFIKSNPVINRRGNLYIIIGRKTFSAAMTNSADFRNETNAILVGEPAGERPNSYQENGTFCLPNSHIHLSVSTKYYKFVSGDPEALFPDKRIDLEWSDYQSGRDPVLTWINQQPLAH
jgi:hypothetical protein